MLRREFRQLGLACILLAATATGALAQQTRQLQPQPPQGTQPGAPTAPPASPVAQPARPITAADCARVYGDVRTACQRALRGDPAGLLVVGRAYAEGHGAQRNDAEAFRF